MIKPTTKLPVTLEDLKRGRLIAARLVDRYGDTYLPIFEEMNRRCEHRLQKQAQREEGMMLVKDILKKDKFNTAKGSIFKKGATSSSVTSAVSPINQAQHHNGAGGGHGPSGQPEHVQVPAQQSDSPENHVADYKDLPLWEVSRSHENTC